MTAFLGLHFFTPKNIQCKLYFWQNAYKTFFIFIAAHWVWFGDLCQIKIHFYIYVKYIQMYSAVFHKYFNMLLCLLCEGEDLS